MNSKKKLKATSLLFLLVGFVFVVVGIIAMIQSDGLKERCTEETIGTVVEVIRERNSNTSNRTSNSYTYFPVIEYQVGDRTVSQKSQFGQNPPKYKVGEQLEICYNPNDIEEYIIKGDSSPKYIGIAFIGLGAIAEVVGAYILFESVRHPDNIEVSPPQV